MRLLVDANLSPRLARLLREQGHDAVHISEVGLGPADDATILDHAADEKRVVVTFDLDFGELIATGVQPPAAVFRLRLRSARVETVARRVLAVIATAGDVLEQGAVAIVEEARIRLRRGSP